MQKQVTKTFTIPNDASDAEALAMVIERWPGHPIAFYGCALMILTRVRIGQEVFLSDAAMHKLLSTHERLAPVRHKIAFKARQKVPEWWFSTGGPEPTYFSPSEFRMLGQRAADMILPDSAHLTPASRETIHHTVMDRFGGSRKQSLQRMVHIINNTETISHNVALLTVEIKNRDKQINALETERARIEQELAQQREEDLAAHRRALGVMDRISRRDGGDEHQGTVQ